MSGYTAVTVAVVGAVTAAGAAVAQGVASSKAASFNAKVADRDAVATRQAAAENAKRFRRTSAKRLAQVRMQGSGNDSFDLLEDSAMEEELEALSILHSGELGALTLTSNADLDRQRAKSALSGGLWKAGSSLLIGGAQAASYMPKGGGSGSGASPVEAVKSPGLDIG
jgi:hypothetical protein|tara:strand:+ start:1675 stop:2178 length:504 start_codon:yes stop_codon:yes gene_type:complete